MEKSINKLRFQIATLQRELSVLEEEMQEKQRHSIRASLRVVLVRKEILLHKDDALDRETPSWESLESYISSSTDVDIIANLFGFEPYNMDDATPIEVESCTMSLLLDGEQA